MHAYIHTHTHTHACAHIHTYKQGEIFLATDPVEVPFSPLPLPPVADTSSKMAYVWITDYVANTAGLVYQKAGKLQYKITPDMVSEQKNAECLNSLLRNSVLNSVHVVVVIAHMLVTSTIDYCETTPVCDSPQITSEFPFQLNTNSFKALVPQVSNEKHIHTY